MLTNAEKFFEKAGRLHHNRYDYSLSEYKNMHYKIAIVCPKHGEFLQEPASHLRCGGCPSCGGVKKKTTTSFIMEAETKYGNLYDYSEVEYKNTDTPVIIKCKVHGKFTQTPYSHLKSKIGCKKCSIFKYTRKTTENFIREVEKIYGDLYIYDKVKYVAAREDIVITCRVHGDFIKKADKFKNGKQGCPECSKEELHWGGWKDEPTLLYYLAFHTNLGTIFKIGIVLKRRGIAERFKYEPTPYTVLEIQDFPSGKDARAHELWFLRAYKSYQYIGKNILKDGNSELFTENVLELHK